MTVLIQPSLPPGIKRGELTEQAREQLTESVRRVLLHRTPRNPDELYRYFGRVHGFWLAHKNVCAEHGSPMEYLARAFFQTDQRMLAMAAKASGKTQALALLHIANSRFKPGCWTAHMGATQNQANRGYYYFLSEVQKRDFADEIEGEPLKVQTMWKNKSRVENLAGTIAAASGPHEQIGCIDEFDQLDWDVWQHFCLTRWAQVVTPTGPVRLGHLVSRKLEGPVRSYSFERRRWEWRPVVGWHRNGVTRAWYQVLTDRSRYGGGSTLTATGCHEVLRLDGQRVRVDRLRAGDEIAIHGRRLGAAQTQIFMGMLLGGGSLTKAGALTTTHAVAQEEYLDWKARAFVEFDTSRFTVPGNAITWRTRVARVFKQAREEWYPAPEQRKRIPASVWEQITELGLAVWFMDDGGYRPHGRCGRWTLSAPMLNAVERAGADRVFARFQITGGWTKLSGREQWVWCSDAAGSQRLTAVFRDYIDVSQKQARGWKRWVCTTTIESSTETVVPATVVTVKPVLRRRETEQLDITVAENHNFLLNTDVLVGNSKTPHEANGIKAQLLLASTRFVKYGPVNRVIEEVGPHLKTVPWCTLEAMQPCPHDCMNAPMGGKCPLYSREVVKDDGTTEEEILCGGRAHQATGHLTYDEVLNAVLVSDAQSFGVLQLLREPGTEGMFYPECNDSVHVSESFEYVAGRDVYLGFDDGFGHPLCLGAWQARDDGLFYQFDELYGTRMLPEHVCNWMAVKPWLKDVKHGWPDPSGMQAIEQMREFFLRVLGRAVMVWDTDNARVDGWRAVRQRLKPAVGPPTIGWHPRCKNSYASLKALLIKDGTEDCEKKNDHGADQDRYLVRNLNRFLGVKEMWDDARRPEGAIEKEQRTMALRHEATIKERWDKLRGLGIPENRLKAVEERYGTHRDDFARGLGEWLSEFTFQGRMRRAGLASDSDEDEEA